MYHTYMLFTKTGMGWAWPANYNLCALGLDINSFLATISKILYTNDLGKLDKH